MLKNYFIIALRNLSRNKLLSAITIFGLSVGLCCCMLIFLYAKDETSFDRFHENRDDIYRVTVDLIRSESTDRSGTTGMPPGPHFKKDLPEITDYARLKSEYFHVKHGREVLEQEALYADPGLFSMFTFQAVHGSLPLALQDIHSVVISESTSEKYFGRSNSIGSILELNINEAWVPFVVSAVMKDAPQNSSIKPQLVLPMAFRQSQHNDKNWINYYLNTFVTVKPGTDIALLETKMNRSYLLAAKEQIEAAKAYGISDKVVYHLQPLSKLHLDTDYIATNGLKGASNPIYSYILVAIALFILIIACINFINLTMAKSLKRAKEIGIRKVIGGQKKQLVFQFLGETFVLVFISFITAIVLALLIIPIFNKVANKELSFSYLLDLKLIVGYVLMFLLTCFISGFYPAVVLSGFKPVETLYGKFRFSKKNRLSKGLIVFQFTLTTCLIIATFTIYSQFNFLMDYDLGIDGKNVLQVNIPALTGGQLETLKQRLKQEPSIESVTGGESGRWNTVAHINGETEIEFNFKHIDENYFSLFKIPLALGRNFITASSDSSESVVVNESFAKAAGWNKPLGQTIDLWSQQKKYKVIGVIRDFHFEPLTSKVIPQVFNINPEYHYGKVFIKIREGKEASAMPYIERIIRNTYTMQPYEYHWWDDEQRSNYESEAKWKQIITFSAILTIFISCMGLFALATLSAEQRTKEIGIRKVLGASRFVIVRKLSVEFISFVAIAALIATPLAWVVMDKWLQSYPYRISPGFGIHAGAVCLVLLIALLTVSYQSIKAAGANPVKNLRTE